MTMKRLVTMLSAMAVALMFTGGASAAAGESVTAAEIAAAKTPAEHEAIAKQYDAEAATAEAQAKEHEAMVQTYETAAKGPKNEMARTMVGHCRNLVKDYKEAAASYKALAADHRKMAAEAGK
jgi:hypothetical protein